MLPNRMMSAFLAPMAVILFLPGTTNAASIAFIVPNHSFEDPVVPMDGNPTTKSNGDDFVIGTPTHWQTPDGTTPVNGSLTRASGSFFADKLAATPDPSDDDQSFWSNGGDHYQVLSAKLVPDMIYTLTVDVGDRTDTDFPAGTAVRLGYGTTIGANLLTADSATNPTPPSGGWATWENVYITGPHPAGLDQPLRIELASDGQQAHFDNVRLTMVAVPEPAAFVLTGFAILGLLLVRRPSGASR